METVRKDQVAISLSEKWSGLGNPPPSSNNVSLKGTAMAWKEFLTAFAAIFIAELGDKTQLAMISLSATSKNPLSIFLGGASALVLLTALAVLAGEAVTRCVPEAALSKIAAVLFVVIGVWTWFRH
jgi:putative Ca2+/H+ antiporter (TMEM165/GDT1 family)